MLTLKRNCWLTLILIFIALNKGYGQAMHFSQYYHAPLLLNPANAALTPQSDYRIGAHYRSQWAALPAPFSTASIFADFQSFRNKNETNWMGIGLAFFNDQVGDGKLSLFRSDITLAYHIQAGEFNMISFGATVSNAQRSVNFSRFSFPVQWDGYTFNRNDPNQEGKGLEKSRFNAVSAGLNYAFLPSDAFNFRVGFSTANINRPVETFFRGSGNRLDFRHSAHVDVLLKTNEDLIVNPSAYYSTQSSAYELLYGSLFLVNMKKPDDQSRSNQLILGAFHRWGDAVVAVAGIQQNGIRLTCSYDYTISTLPANAGRGTGALEMSLIFEGVYNENSMTRGIYHCPRF